MAKESVEEREIRALGTTSPEELEKLAVDEDENVRTLVAENENTPVLTLEKLAADEDEGVRDGVAENQNTPIAVREKLATDKDH